MLSCPLGLLIAEQLQGEEAIRCVKEAALGFVRRFLQRQVVDASPLANQQGD